MGSSVQPNLGSSVAWQETVLPSAEDEAELGVRGIIRAYALTIPAGLLEGAQVELETAGEEGVYSFNPSFEKDLHKFTQTMGLVRYLAKYLFEPQGTDLSFIRRSCEQPGVFIGNLHHDWKYVGFNERTGQTGNVIKPSASNEIWRQIINLGSTPRYVQIVDAPLQHFRDQGIDTDTIRPQGSLVATAGSVGDVDSSIIAPAILENYSQTYPIPPYDGKFLHVFEFWASRILHAGITDSSGHFMAAAARWQEISGIE